MDGAGNLLISDTGNQRIRVVAAAPGTFYGQAMTAGDIYTIAGDGTGGFSGDGGPATSAELNSPHGVATDGAGNLLIADAGNSRIRVVAARRAPSTGKTMTAGDIYTIAGNGTPGFSGDGGPATSAELQHPGGRGGRRRREPADRRHVQPPDPGGNGLTPPAADASRGCMPGICGCLAVIAWPDEEVIVAGRWWRVPGRF